MFGAGFGFVLNQPNGLSSSGGGGTTYVPEEFEHVQTASFIAGGLIIPLPNQPVAPTLFVYYNGVEIRPGAGGYTLSGDDVTVDFSDDPSTYDNGEVVFYFRYWYT